MSSEGLRRSITLSIICVASLTLAYCAYRNYKHTRTPKPPSPTLHRSNAIRRPHRRVASNETRTSPIEEALKAIQESQQGRRAFGQYEVTDPSEIDLQSEISLDLTISNLKSLHTVIVARHPEWDEETRSGKYRDLQLALIFNLLIEFWPTGSTVVGEDRTRLTEALTLVNIESAWVRTAINILNDNTVLAENPRQTNGGPRDAHEDHQAVGVLEDDEETVAMDELDQDGGDGQNILNLLFHIAGEQAKRNGYIHRGIECNGCGVCPIQGIRYHCANCFDYDLCETCESQQIHIKSHVFFKVRIPAPSRGQIKQVFPKWYPGNPNYFPQRLPTTALDLLVAEIDMERTEIEALFEQFKGLASHEYNPDPCHLGMAIDRKGFDMYFIPGKSDKSAPANLIYDRIFAFYDTNDDGLIGFAEFVKGLARLQSDKSRAARLQRIFEGYDLDGDGFVDRKDFLRMFRAYYDLSRQLNREMISAQEDFGYLDEEIREVVQGSQPISAAFGGSVLFGHESRGGEDKHMGAHGDLRLSHGQNGVLQNDLDPRGDRVRAIGNAAIGNRPRSHPFRTFRTEPPEDEQLMQLPIHNNFELVGIQHADDATEEEINGPEPPMHTYGWPPLLSPEPDDVIAALGADIPVEEITDPLERSRVIFAQAQRLDGDSDRYQDWQREKAAYERWKRRQFYLDEEEGFTKPQGYTEPDTSDEESVEVKPETSASSRRQSLRSRSSSKVRFDDSAIDTDYETRSNASSRSIPTNERWGGYELGQPEFDVGRDALYEAVQQGFNELLDSLFKSTEDEAMDAASSVRDRRRWKTLLDEHEEKLRKAAENKEERLKQADALRTEALFAAANEVIENDLTQESPAKPAEDGEAPAPANPASEGPDPDPDTDTFNDKLKEHFGDQIKNAIAAAVSDVKVAASFSRPESSDPEPESASSERDPTLPQFRPDYPSDDDTTEAKPSAKSKSKGKAKTPDPPPTTETLEKWLKHRKYEEMAKERGGSGRLNLKEFRRRMVADDDDSSSLFGGNKAEGKKDGGEGEDGDGKGEEYWEKSAGLGKLAFVGTWLEMASF